MAAFSQITPVPVDSTFGHPDSRGASGIGASCARIQNAHTKKRDSDCPDERLIHALFIPIAAVRSETSDDSAPWGAIATEHKTNTPVDPEKASKNCHNFAEVQTTSDGRNRSKQRCPVNRRLIGITALIGTGPQWVIVES